MARMKGDSIFILSYLNSSKTDIIGNQYPNFGYVKAEEFTKNEDIRKGLFGFLWKETENFSYISDVTNGYWVVVKTQNNQNVIELDYWDGSVKFEGGIIVHMGTLKTARNFMKKNK